MEPQQIPYKTIGGATLHLHRFEPDRSRFPGLRPSVVLWFGGGWMNGTAGQFFRYCEALSAKGIDTFSAEYRIGGRTRRPVRRIVWRPSRPGPVGGAPLDALLLFNPVVDTTVQRFVDRFADRGIELSPMHHLRPSLPPSLVMHGTDDRIVPFEHVQRFARRMAELGNRCELVPFEGRGHGFFNPGQASGRPGDDAAAQRSAEAFLGTLDYYDINQ